MEIRARDEPPQRLHEIGRLVERVIAVGFCAPVVERHEGRMGPRHDLAHLLDARAGEEKTLRVHVAHLNEAPRLPGAPAGVRLIDEPALVIHETVQVAAGPREALAEVVRADLHQLGADGVTYREDLAEDVDEALPTA